MLEDITLLNLKTSIPEKGIIKVCTKKPAKMGVDYIFWIPRVLHKNGIVDVNTEYEVYIKKVPKKVE